MTIDEAIESLKSDYEIDMYIRDIAPQLAEWLDDLLEGNCHKVCARDVGFCKSRNCKGGISDWLKAEREG